MPLQARRKGGSPLALQGHRAQNTQRRNQPVGISVCVRHMTGGGCRDGRLPVLKLNSPEQPGVRSDVGKMTPKTHRVVKRLLPRRSEATRPGPRTVW